MSESCRLSFALREKELDESEVSDSIIFEMAAWSLPGECSDASDFRREFREISTDGCSVLESRSAGCIQGKKRTRSGRVVMSDEHIMAIKSSSVDQSGCQI